MRRGTRSRAPEPPPASPAIAILFDDDEPDPPSNAAALEKFTVAARALGMRPSFIGRDDIDRLDAFDGLFIRDTTNVNHYTYQFARRAAAGGLVVVDDPDSILKCTNKVYLNELLSRAQRAGAEDADRSSGQRRSDRPGARAAVHTEAAGQRVLARRRRRSRPSRRCDECLEHVFAQIRPGRRPGVAADAVRLARRRVRPPAALRLQVLHGARALAGRQARIGAHARRVDRRAVRRRSAAKSSCAPRVRAANLIGDGLYGVDLKQDGQQCYVMEVNDNPNIDAGNEDGVLQGRALSRGHGRVPAAHPRAQAAGAMTARFALPRVRGLRHRARVHDRRSRLACRAARSPTLLLADAAGAPPAVRQRSIGPTSWSRHVIEIEERRADAAHSQRCLRFSRRHARRESRCSRR